MTNSDVLLDRVQLKQKLKKWQLLAIVTVVVSIIGIASIVPGNKKEVVVGEANKDYIARINIEGIIVDDMYREKVLHDIIDDKRARAVIINVDSPGGTTGGGESLYNSILDISKSGKPVVVVMRTLATSAGYMIALGGDHIVARHGTITGSIGVLIQSFEVTDLAQKLGIGLISIKSSELKASPSPFEKMSPAANEAIQAVITDYYNTFVGMVAERRKMPMEKVYTIADGRIYTGTQALKNGLIDEIGGEKEARAWLEKEKKIGKKVEIEDVATTKPEKSFAELFFGDGEKSKMLNELTMQGLLAIWKPSNIN